MLAKTEMALLFLPIAVFWLLLPVGVRVVVVVPPTGRVTAVIRPGVPRVVAVLPLPSAVLWLLLPKVVVARLVKPPAVLVLLLPVALVVVVVDVPSVESATVTGHPPKVWRHGL